MNSEPAELERCVKCNIPITWETVVLTESGCNICSNWEIKQKDVDWQEREKQFLDVVAEAREQGAPYDCVLPFSGGKDSTFTLYMVVKKYKLKPLVVSFDHGFYRPRMQENRLRTFRQLGVDVLSFTPNWLIVKKLMLEALIRRGDFCWHCHSGIFAYPVNVACKFKIPLIIWGEGGGEYEAYFKYQDLEETDEWKFNRRIVLGIRAEDMAGFIGVEPRELYPYMYPSRKEIEEVGIRSVPFGNYIPWDVKKHVAIIEKELGWQEDEIESGLPGLTYEKIECAMQGVRDYAKFLKRGFSRVTHLTALDIRHGRMDREQALELIHEYEWKKPRSLEVFCEYAGITEDQFHEIVLQHVIAPHKPIDPDILPYGEKLWDQDYWYREYGREKAGQASKLETV